MRYRHDLRKANRRFLLVNVCLALMVILIVLAFWYMTLPAGK